MSGDDGVEYEPVSVKAVLSEMKDIAALLVDLSYSSVLFRNEELAAEVLELESEMDVLQLQARMSLMMAARSPADAEALAPVLGIIGAAEKISDAAGDVAKVVLEEVGLPEALRASLPEAVEPLARATVAADSAWAGQTLGEINLETETGVRAFAIRRDDDWLLNPSRDTRFLADDVVLCRGPADGVDRVYEALTGESLERSVPEPASIEDLDRAVETVVLMKTMSELAVDVAYGSVLFDSADLAEEVRELEVEVDALQSRFEAWALRAAATVEDPVTIRGLLHIAASTEVISDAAVEISEGVLRGFGSHPVVQEAVDESDEILVRVQVAPGSDLDGTTIGDMEIGTRTGMTVVALRRAEAMRGDSRTDWVLSPSAETTLRTGDTLLAKGTRAGRPRLADLAS